MAKMYFAKIVACLVLILVCEASNRPMKFKGRKGPNDTTHGSGTCMDSAKSHPNLLGGWHKKDASQVDGWDKIEISLIDELNRKSGVLGASTFRPSSSNNGNRVHEIYSQVVSRATNLCIEFEADKCSARDSLCQNPKPRSFVAEVRQTYGPLLLGGEPQSNVQVIKVTPI